MTYRVCFEVGVALVGPGYNTAIIAMQPNNCSRMEDETK